MKDLIGKRALVRADGIFEGEKTLEGFQYNEAGTLVSWKNMPPGIREVPIGALFIVKTPEDDTATVREKTAKEKREEAAVREKAEGRIRKELAAEYETEAEALRQETEALRKKLAETEAKALADAKAAEQLLSGTPSDQAPGS